MVRGGKCDGLFEWSGWKKLCAGQLMAQSDRWWLTWMKNEEEKRGKKAGAGGEEGTRLIKQRDHLNDDGVQGRGSRVKRAGA